MRSPRTLGAIAVALVFAGGGCSTPVTLSDNPPSDEAVLDCGDVTNVAYTVDYSEVYTGDHELKRAAIVTATSSFEFTRTGAPGTEKFAQGIAEGIAEELERTGIACLLPSKLGPAGDKVGLAGQPGHAPGSRHPGMRFPGFRPMDPDDVGAVTREADVDFLILVGADPDKAHAWVCVPFGRFKPAATGKVPFFPVNFNHVKDVRVEYRGGLGSQLATGRAVGRLVARRFRLYYPKPGGA